MGSHRQLLIAGPCAAESDEQLHRTAAELAALQIPVDYFRAGVWKPRTHPDDFLGMGDVAFAPLKEIREKYLFPICVEVLNPRHVEKCVENHIDAVWLGARTTVNPFTVQEIANALQGTSLTVMVKNPIAPDLKLWMGAIDRVQRAGIKNIIAIHRGFAHDTDIKYRNNPLWKIPIALKMEYPHIPVICDASHTAGATQYIEEVVQSSCSYGLEGWMIETHCNPQSALCDAKQQVTPKELAVILEKIANQPPLSDVSKQLEMLRERVSSIDQQVAKLLLERMKAVDEIANLKIENNMPVVQHDQWQKVQQRYLEISENDPHFQSFIKLFLELLHQQSIERQRGDGY